MELYTKDGSRYRPAQTWEVREVARSYLREEARGTALTAPQKTREFLREMLGGRKHEHMLGIFLDVRHRVIDSVEMFHGTIDSAHVHPRVVVEHALRLNTAGVIMAHNHPSGIPEPSQADLAITRRVRDALSLLDMRLLDHFIVGGDEIVSLAERGLV
jgi:DNA repair protein RadC